MRDILNDINGLAGAFGSLPFWSWNDELDPARLEEQIDQMHGAGIGGFFMHARGGLTTPYMGEKWMDCIRVCMDKAKALNMQAWAYDENGWPSGFADGAVPSAGEQYQQKYLVLEQIGEGERDSSRDLAYFSMPGDDPRNLVYLDASELSAYCVKYEVNRYYIDALNRDAITEFIIQTHEKYRSEFKEQFGGELAGFFTDEPQYGNNWLIPWSPVLEANFKEAYGRDIRGGLAALFFETEGCAEFRHAYYTLTHSLFVNGFIRQLYEWCEANGCKLTGHMMGEDLLLTQLFSTGGVMDCYPYFHIPGIDWLGRKIDSPMIPKQLGSAAAQLGKTQTLTESFALCGWDVSFDELKWIAGWQFVNGVNLVCQHLEGYSLRGARKRDYPASLFVHQPWWPRYGVLNEYLTKTGAALSMGTDAADVLILHPLKTGYTVYTPRDISELERYNSLFAGLSSRLSGRQVLHHYGDETLMTDYGRIENDMLIIGEHSYRTVILPDMRTITRPVLDMLLEFHAAGGRLFSAGELPTLVDGRADSGAAELSAACAPLPGDFEQESPIRLEGEGSEDVHLHVRLLENGERLAYFVNLSREPREMNVIVRGEQALSLVDVTAGTQVPYPAVYSTGVKILREQGPTAGANGGGGKALCCAAMTFAPMQQRLIHLAPGRYEAETAKPAQIIKLKNRFDIRGRSLNTFTLDSCEYRVDGGKWQPKAEVIHIQAELLALRRPCDIDLRFSFTIDEMPPCLYLLVESPELYQISLNGREIPSADCGYMIDWSFRKLDIAEYVADGKNELVLSCRFEQSEHVYHVLFDPGVHESEKNKLTLGTELESVYLAGDFGLKHMGTIEYGERKTIFTTGDFSLAKAPSQVDINAIPESGFWFFSGHMELEQTVNINPLPGVRYAVRLDKLHCPVASLRVNGKDAGDFAFAPHEIDVTDLLFSGDNVFTITLYSGNRNLLGPHHYPGGESYAVGPGTFLETDNIHPDDRSFSPQRFDYCLVRFGVVLPE